MASTALVAAFVWCLTIFGLRDYIHRRRTGASGIVRTPRDLGPRANVAGVLLLGAMNLLIAAALLELKGKLAPLWDTSRPGARLAAVALFLVGWIGTFLCQLAMGDSWRIGIDRARATKLVTGGPYAFSRNPIYLCVMVSAGAFVAAVPNGASIVAWMLIVLGFDLWVRWVEEPFLAARHGPAFRDYASRVGRFVPGFGKLRAP